MSLMRVARLHGIEDLRVELIPTPEPGPGELLVRIEACGICPTDVRKYLIGVNDGDYPFNPGHEWIGRVESVGKAVDGWAPGQRVYGDTYGGYAELALLPVEPGPWSHGPLSVPDDLPLERAIFVEPLADCLHAVYDQARVEPGNRVVVVGGGQMGLQLIAAASLARARVLCVEPLAERCEVALAYGAEEAVEPEAWSRRVRLWSGGEGADAVILSIGVPQLVAPAVEAVGSGGRVVLFAGFGDAGEARIDVNRLHYGEISLIGSEWIGVPPNQRRRRYGEALQLLVSGQAPFERLVSSSCGFGGLESAFGAQRARQGLKAMLLPGEE